MAIIDEAKPARGAWWAAARGLATGGMLGAGGAFLLVGAVAGRADLLEVGARVVGFLVCSALVLHAARGMRKPVPEVDIALASIVSRRAIGGESGDVPVEFVLSVAPDEGSAYRARATQVVNLVDLGEYGPGRVVVVEYRPAQPWWVRIVPEPTTWWAERATREPLDAAPESTLVTRPARSGVFGTAAVVAFLVGASLVGVPHRAEFTAKSTVRSGASSSATVVTGSMSSTTSYAGSSMSDSMLRAGEMRRAAQALTSGAGEAVITEISVEERRMSAVGALPAPADGLPGLDPGALPFERLPAAVREATSDPALRAPATWRVDVTRREGTGAPLILITAKDATTSVTVEVDARGRIVGRPPR